MHETILKVQVNTELERSPAAVALLDLPVAKLQLVQAGDVVKDQWLHRALLEPQLVHNADGLWMLTVRRQGEHSRFEVPYIGSEIILADAELGLVVVLVGWHGTTPEKYGRLGYLLPKGQFYRYYQQATDGTWSQVLWRQLNDALRALILDAVKEHAPDWARSPGKLQAERKPPAKPVTMTSYKVVRVIDGRYFSLYNPEQEYVLGQRHKEPAKPKHGADSTRIPRLKWAPSTWRIVWRLCRSIERLLLKRWRYWNARLAAKSSIMDTRWHPRTCVRCGCWKCGLWNGGKAAPLPDAIDEVDEEC